MISGVLMNQRNWIYDVFDIPQTSYVDIGNQIREAEADPNVRAIELQVDSGGGQASNMLVDTANLIAATKKPVAAVVGDMAASAAYWLASQANTITLRGAATMVGSIGVAVQMRVSDDVIHIASTEAPNKRPDPRTDTGKTTIRRELDGIHTLFVDAVARGRGVDAGTVNRDFGRGGVLLAAEAIEAGMADSVLSAVPIPAARVKVAAMSTLTLAALRMDHPELVAEIVKAERSRVSAHLMLAEKSGAWSASAEHIKEGREADSEVIAVHTVAAMEKNSVAARVAAEPSAVPATQPSAADGMSDLDRDINATYDAHKRG